MEVGINWNLAKTISFCSKNIAISAILLDAATSLMSVVNACACSVCNFLF